ncbi:MAG: hypothetical protein WA830_13480 [Candidatus Sulfotelmatobacter sp.]
MARTVKFFLVAHPRVAIKQVAEEAGFEMTDIVSVTVYVTDLKGEC